MYKYLLCWRYLKTRYIALASVISVMLGVATMIVVNSVMAGFSEKMRDRLHGVLSDVVIEGTSFDGFANPSEVMALVRQIGGDRVQALAPTIEVPGIMTYHYGGEPIMRPVQIIGVDPEARARTGDFAEYLIDEEGNKVPPSFEVDPKLRSRSAAAQVLLERHQMDEQDTEIDTLLQQHALNDVPDQGAIPGYATVTHHPPGATTDMFLAPRGGKVVLHFPTAGVGGAEIKAARDSFAVVGFFKSGMSEYDSQFVYIPLKRLQYLRGMGDGQSEGFVNQIQIKVTPGTDLDRLALDLNRVLFQKWPMRFAVRTWEQKQGALLSAVAVEQSILNILLFFIIAVAGFGILAIFSMIVVEKTRDIGILKALGASTSGVRGIFLGYGLSLGLVGSGVGMLGGLVFVRNINVIEKWLSWALGHKVFDDTIYYFSEIPTRIDPLTVLWIVLGALLIAVTASIWPAHRASKLHPVRALRYE